MQYNLQGMSVMDTTSLNYFINAPSGISLHPLSSDSMSNAILMKHFVGTLVRYSNGGQFLPYLSEKFKSVDNGLVWRFTLRSDLICEDGESITAQGYIDGLKKVLKMYASQGRLPIIENIVGWNAFLDGKNLSGIKALSYNEIEFEFDNAVGPGFLEYLSMPYYGYFCNANFSGNEWKDKNHIVSSGSYRLDAKNDDAKYIVLKERSNWPLNPESAPEKVIFHTVVNELSWKEKRSVVQYKLGWDTKSSLEHLEVQGPPDAIRCIILDPTGPSGFFANVQARRVLQNKILSLRRTIQFPSKTATLASGFYAASNPKYIDASTYVHPKEKLKIYYAKTTNDEVNYSIRLLEKALNELGWTYEFFIDGQTQGVESVDAQSRTKFDIRISGVIAGSVVEPWVVEMIFGSNQGVSYPDPSGKVSEYASKLNKEVNFSFKQAGDHISQLIADDAAVIPIYHSHTTWYFTKDLDVNRISGDMIIPSFEDIGIKN